VNVVDGCVYCALLVAWILLYLFVNGHDEQRSTGANNDCQPRMSQMCIGIHPLLEQTNSDGNNIMGTRSEVTCSIS
jgi:regulatory protein YycI of two-component signal transduction system YycFG